MITLKNLQYLKILYKTPHFTQAAQKAFVSVSTLSTGISNLEASLGQQLIQRNNKSVVFTSLGNQIALQASKIIEETEVLKQMAYQDFFKSNVTIGIIPTISAYILPKFLTSITHTYPELAVQYKEYTSNKLIEEIYEGKVDFAIFAFPYEVPTYITKQILFTENIYFIRHTERKSQKFIEHSVLLPEEGHCLRDHILMNNAIDKEYISTSSFTTLHSVMPIVNLNRGVSFIPQMAIDAGILDDYPNIYVDPIYKKSSRKIGIIYRKNNPLSDNLLQLAQLILE